VSLFFYAGRYESRTRTPADDGVLHDLGCSGGPVAYSER